MEPAQDIPAAFAAFPPLVESSTTIHAEGSSNNASAAARNVSGAGFGCAIFSPLIKAEKY